MTVTLTVIGVADFPYTDTLSVVPPASQTSTTTYTRVGMGFVQTTGNYLNINFQNIAANGPDPTVVAFDALYGSGLSYNLLAANPARDLPWQIKGIQAVFSEPVNGALRSLLIGGNGAPVVSSVSGYGTSTVTWTFTTPMSIANVLSRLESGSTVNSIYSTNGGAPLAGDPNQSGPANFEQAFGVLYGDVDGNGVVNIIDALYVSRYITGTRYPSIPDIFFDVNGDGVVNSTDLTDVRLQIGTSLPPGSFEDSAVIQGSSVNQSLTAVSQSSASTNSGGTVIVYGVIDDNAGKIVSNQSKKNPLGVSSV
jgi:Dockerin type I domain